MTVLASHVMLTAVNEATKASIERAERHFDEDVKLVAAQYRREVLVPLCVKRGLRFLSGNGTFLFLKMHRGQEVSISTHLDVKQYGEPLLSTIIDTLNLPVGPKFVLGDYVEDIRGEQRVVRRKKA